MPPRPDSLAWLAPRRRERGDEVDGDCRRMGARAAGALPVRQRRALRSRLAPGAAPGGGRGAAGAVRGAPGSGHSPARGPLRAARTPRHVRPRGRAGTSCPGLGLSRTLRSPPRLSRASPCARAELTAGKTCWGPGSGRRASPWTGAVAPSDSAELRVCQLRLCFGDVPALAGILQAGAPRVCWKAFASGLSSCGLELTYFSSLLTFPLPFLDRCQFND